jgi:hypothetical protein
MSFRDLADRAIELAEMGSVVFPPLGTGAALADKVLDLLDGLKDEAPDQESEEDLEAAHQALYDAMTAKGHKLSERLRG